MNTQTWYGPALNSPGHKYHGAKPVITNGVHSGWLMPELKDSRQQPKSLAHKLRDHANRYWALQRKLENAQREVTLLQELITETA